MTTPVRPPAEPNVGPQRETLPPPTDPYADAFDDDDPDDAAPIPSV